MSGSYQPDRPIRHVLELLDDRYEVLALVGEGGSGTVFEVRNRALQRLEALKILTGPSLDPDDAKRFTHEAKIAASLDHPNIVHIHTFGQEEGVLWYSMQLVEGPTLSALLDGGEVLDGSMLARVAIPILDALAFSHDRGVIHRDIKPANILFGLDGHPYLADFGIAKTSENLFMTRTGQFLGTPAYVAPEQAMGEVVDARADLYALGMTLYKAAAGRLPFNTDSFMQTLLLRLQEPPEPLADLCPSLEPALAGLIMKALARDREQRFSGAAEMRAEFLRASAAAGIALDQPLTIVREFPLVRRDIQSLALPEPGPGRRPRGLEATADLPRAQKHPGRWAGVAALLLLAAVGLAFGLRQRTRAVVSPPSVPTARNPGQVQAVAEVPKPGPPLKVAAARAAQPQPEPPPRRPVVYPVLLGDPPTVQGPAACAGLSVTVSLLVTEAGEVKSCRVLSAVPPECAEAARAAAMRYHFKPALDALGQPVQSTLAAAVEFPEGR